jgi:hypothetical protein
MNDSTYDSASVSGIKGGALLSDLWLDNHPGKTPADFDREMNGRGTRKSASEFLTWLRLLEMVGDGYAIRLGGGKYRWTKKQP